MFPIKISLGKEGKCSCGLYEWALYLIPLSISKWHLIRWDQVQTLLQLEGVTDKIGPVRCKTMVEQAQNGIDKTGLLVYLSVKCIQWHLKSPHNVLNQSNFKIKTIRFFLFEEFIAGTSLLTGIATW